MDAECIIFDLDGTLADTLPDIVLAVNRMRAEFNLTALSKEIVSSYIGNGFEKLLERSLNGTGVTPDMARGVLQEKFAASLNQESKLFPGVFAGLQALHKAGIRLALLSNKPEDFCKFILYDFGIGGFFDIIFGGTEDYPLKPDPSSAFAIMEFSGVRDRRNVWILGDGVPDMETGRRAGINRAFAAWGYGRPERESYQARFESFAEFADFILKK